MLDNRYDPSPVLAFYPADCRPFGKGAEAVSAGGFSGSRLWRLHAAGGELCLRRWPQEYSDQNRLQWIHGVLAGAFQRGFRLVPVPIKTATGESFVSHDEYLWQLEPWLAGVADDATSPFRPAPPARIAAALTALAEFHRAVVADPANCFPDGPALGLVKRLARLQALQSGGLDRLTDEIAIHKNVWPELAKRASPLLEPFRSAGRRVMEMLQQASDWKVPIRPCIRDIHRQHVLFTDDRVTGIVDFGAMQPDHVAGDIARLLGSLAADDPALWQIGLEAYQRLQPLTAQDHLLVTIYHESGLLLSGISWLQWVFVDGRHFENRPAVLARVDEIVGRLAWFTSRSASSGAISV